MTSVSQPPPDRHDPEDIDRRFREIVDGLRSPAPPPGDVGTGEIIGGVDREGPAAAPRPAQPQPRPTEGMATDHRSYSPPEDEEDDHFVPPPPPPLPAGDLHFWAIVGGLVLGPLLVVLSAVLPLLSARWTTVGAALTLAGFVLLVLRLPRHRGDGDWGARV